MAKFGIGVGEEFPAGEPTPDLLSPDHPHRHGGWRVALHIAFRLAVIALVIGAAVALFHGFGGPYPGPYGYHRYGFFPFFPLLVIVLLILALRRGHYCGHGWRMRYRYDEMRHWHDRMHRERGETP